jgi:hypothetical protein
VTDVITKGRQIAEHRSVPRKTGLALSHPDDFKTKIDQRDGDNGGSRLREPEDVSVL